jgi:hypothetical protein
MTEEEFQRIQPGDRVIYRGCITGTVVHIGSFFAGEPRWAVKFDWMNMYGHTCEGSFPSGRGRWLTVGIELEDWELQRLTLKEAITQIWSPLL